MKQAPQGSSRSPKSDRVQEVLKNQSQVHGCDFCDGLVQSQEMTSMVLVGHFQLSIFYHSEYITMFQTKAF